LAKDVRVTISQVQYYDQSPTRVDEWVKITASGNRAGWAAAYFDNQEYIVYDTTQACMDVRFPTLETSWGIWVGTGADRAELLRFGNTIKQAGRTPVATVYGENDAAVALHNADWIVALRPWYADGDGCANGADPKAAAAKRWETARALTATIPHDWLVLTNECIWPSAVYARDWISEIAARAGAAHVRVVPVVFSTGTPALDWWPVLYPALEQLRDAGGCLGLNLYPAVPGMLLTDPNPQTLWTVYRWRLFEQMLPKGLSLCVTEFAAGVGEQSPDFYDTEAFMVRADGHFAWATGWLDSMPLPPWQQATMRGKLDSFAQAIRKAIA
jgi:hypothetical protein